MRLPHFRRIRTRLAVLYAGLFALVLFVIALMAQVMILENAKTSVRSELTTSGSVYDRIWALRSRALSDSADVLARDFGFRGAIASNDVPTIESALENLRSRARVSTAFIVMQDGAVIGEGDAALKDGISEIPYTLPGGRGSGITAIGDEAYRIIVAPVLAPVEIGWVVFAVHLDAAEMRTLEKLSAIPLTASVLHRDAGGAWRGTGAAPDTAMLQLAQQALSTRSAQPREIDTGEGSAIALAKPLPAIAEGEASVLLLRYPLARAMASFRPLQLGVLVTGLLGLLIVIAGSLRLAASISRPIAQLDDAAKRLETGDRIQVPVTGQDEIGRLAESFNAMSRGIFEREDRIAHMAFNDSLTGLPNRVFFREQLDRRLRRAATGDGFAILCLDLDGFKDINDTMGHPFGDRVLCSVGALLAETAPEAFVARLGGDEFALILPEGSDGEAARALGQKLVERMLRPVDVGDQQVLVGTSVGIALAPQDGDCADELIKNADLALYRAKHDGRGAYRFFEPDLDAQAQARRQLEIDLREALAEGQFHLHFQPIYAASGDRIVCFETLLRWNHPVRGAVGPDVFIPVAEECGLIGRMGEWVLNEACRHARAWDPAIRIAVNVSARQFRNPGLNASILQALANSGIDPKRLEIEITESIFLDDGGDTIAMLHSLRALGVRIALDDFGTGYSSLSYLRSFPFDKIKIDKSFVNDISRAADAEAIVHAILQLATALGMETTAEGVETQEQLDKLRSHGCDSIQGYLMSRPISAAEAGRLADTVAAAARAA
ncbi:putative bifunctional diguanylate cyclase/phosphodiesterase [Allosphingosinicella indica]|nr:EAL domain-containing protein [Allosphingosinicella indica]